MDCKSMQPVGQEVWETIMAYGCCCWTPGEWTWTVKFDLVGNTAICIKYEQIKYDDTRWIKGRALIRPNQKITFTFSKLFPAALSGSLVRKKKKKKNSR